MTSNIGLLESLTPIEHGSSETVRIAFAQDSRSPLVEFRLAISAADTVCPDGRTLAALLTGQELWTAFTEVVGDMGGNCSVEDRGEWAVIKGRVLPWDMEWASSLTAVITGLTKQLQEHASALAALPVTDPLQIAWADKFGDLSASGPRVVFAVVGPVDDGAIKALQDEIGSAAKALTLQEIPAVTRPQSDPPSYGEDDSVTLWIGGKEPAGDTHSCARFIATGLLTADPTSKLIGRLDEAPGNVEQMLIGRDSHFGTPRVYGLLQTQARDVSAFVDWARMTIADSAAWNVEATAYKTLVEYCVTNITEAFESPQALCDATVDGLMRGAPASWLTNLARGLASVTLEEAQVTADSTFASLGDVVAVLRA